MWGGLKNTCRAGRFCQRFPALQAHHVTLSSTMGLFFRNTYSVCLLLPKELTALFVPTYTNLSSVFDHVWVTILKRFHLLHLNKLCFILYLAKSILQTLKPKMHRWLKNDGACLICVMNLVVIINSHSIFYLLLLLRK